MQIHVKNLMVGLFLSTLVAGCSGGMLRSGASGENAFLAERQILSCAVGGQVRVSLDANPSTGFSWALADRPDAKILTSPKEDFTPAAEGRVGAGGQSVWTSDCMAAGTTNFTLVYRRVWETGVPPAKTMRYEVRVGESS